MVSRPPSPSGPCSIRPLEPGELAACLPLAAEGLGLSEPDQIPPWMMHTTNAYGGLTLGAFCGSPLVGYSYALPGYDGGAFLLSCGLAVARSHQGRGIGGALKLAQAREARRAGYELVRWTTGSLASRPLHLYLSTLGARLVRLHADMYAEVRKVPLSDEAEVEWDLRREPPIARAAGTVAGRRVEIPWDAVELERRSPRQAQRWLQRVRRDMRALLDDGHVGSAVELDRPARRSFVVFEPREQA